MNFRPALALAIAALALSACQDRQDRIAFDGQFFRANLDRAGDQREAFSVAIRPASASLDGARAAGRYHAIRYCVLEFGNSEIEWLVGPDQDPASYTIDGDTLVLQGNCEG